MSGLIDQVNLPGFLPIKQMFESTHLYTFIHNDIPNAIPFEKIPKQAITSENMILEIVILFLKLEKSLNDKNFFCTDVETGDYLIVLPNK